MRATGRFDFRIRRGVCQAVRGRFLSARRLRYNHGMDFEIVGMVTNIENIAVDAAIRERDRLVAAYGAGRWRKVKGAALIRRADGSHIVAELHWYEANGIGRKEVKIKRILDAAPEVE